MRGQRGDRGLYKAGRQWWGIGANPLLRAAGALYRDDVHNQHIRAHYDTSFELLSQKLDITVPGGGFFLWLPVPEVLGGDDKKMTAELYRQAGIRSVPAR